MRSSAGEHLVDIEGVTGSIPVASTILLRISPAPKSGPNGLNPNLQDHVIASTAPAVGRDASPGPDQRQTGAAAALDVRFVEKGRPRVKGRARVARGQPGPAACPLKPQHNPAADRRIAVLDHIHRPLLEHDGQPIREVRMDPVLPREGPRQPDGATRGGCVGAGACDERSQGLGRGGKLGYECGHVRGG